MEESEINPPKTTSKDSGNGCSEESVKSTQKLSYSHSDTSLRERNQSMTTTTRIEITSSTMQDLNNRLANYIDRIKSISSLGGGDSSTYTDQSYSKISVEFNKIKSRYENEIEVYTKQVKVVKQENQTLAGKLAEMDKENKQLSKDNKEMEGKQKLATEKIASMEKTIRESDKTVAELVKDAQVSKAQLEEYKKEIARLKKEGDVLNKKITTLENSYQNLAYESEQKEKKYILNKDVQETNIKQFAMEISSLKTVIKKADKKNDQFDKIIQEKVLELHREFETTLFSLKRELAAMYENKIEVLKAELRLKSDLTEKERKMLQENDQLIENYKKETNDLKLRIFTLEKKIEIEKKAYKETQTELLGKADHYCKMYNSAKEELLLITAKFEELDMLYKVLLGEKTENDAELGTYKKLLEAEEERLHIEQVDKPTKKNSLLNVSSSTLLKITSLHHSDDARITFWSVSEDYILFKNISAKKFNLKDCEIRMISSDDNFNDIVFKFEDNIVLKSDEHIKIFGSYSEKVCSLMQENDLCMDNNGWFNAQNIITHKYTRIVFQDPTGLVLSELLLEICVEKSSRKRKCVSAPLSNVFSSTDYEMPIDYQKKASCRIV